MPVFVPQSQSFGRCHATSSSAHAPLFRSAYPRGNRPRIRAAASNHTWEFRLSDLVPHADAEIRHGSIIDTVEPPPPLPPSTSKWFRWRRSGVALINYLLDSEVHTFAFSVAANAIISFIPFILLLLLVLGIITYVPILSLWLPDLVYGGH